MDITQTVIAIVVLVVSLAIVYVILSRHQTANIQSVVLATIQAANANPALLNAVEGYRTSVPYELMSAFLRVTVVALSLAAPSNPELSTIKAEIEKFMTKTSDGVPEPTGEAPPAPPPDASVQINTPSVLIKTPGQ